MSETIFRHGSITIQVEHPNELRITGVHVENGTLMDLKLYVADLLRRKAKELEAEAGREVIHEVVL